MPSYLNVYNASLEDFKTQFRSKGYRFKARSLTKLPEEFEYALAQYEKHGLVVISPGDDLKAKEKQAHMSYLGFLMEIRSYLHMYMDEKKRAGVTIDTPYRLKQIEQWIAELNKKYQMDESFGPIASFDEVKPLDAKELFAGQVDVTTVQELVKKRGRPAKSFAEVDISEEIKS